MRHYERRLPHWDSVGQPVFVTFRLRGSLSGNRVFPPANLTSGESFRAVDKLLDQARTGPLFLKQKELAQMVVAAIRDGEMRLSRYELHSYVVMPNHVHLLVTSLVANANWLGPLKGFTGSKANGILKRTGAFWQDESYDHLIRNAEDFSGVRRYIENNPVAAGLVARPEDFPWSSAALGVGQRFRPAAAFPGG
ncbi:MAG TPA: transposase [Bryobacteraceae bacterium]|nr:transposase [Bryobacteraceae bacterium]